MQYKCTPHIILKKGVLLLTAQLKDEERIESLHNIVRCIEVIYYGVERALYSDLSYYR